MIAVLKIDSFLRSWGIVKNPERIMEKRTSPVGRE